MPCPTPRSEEFEVSSDMSMQFEFVTSVEVEQSTTKRTSASFNPDDGKVIGADTSSASHGKDSLRLLLQMNQASLQ